MAQPIPQALGHLVVLNIEYGVLICIDSKCKRALAPSAISRHLGDRHKTPIEARRQLEQYVEQFPFAYDHASVPLPYDGSTPQPIIPILEGFQCRNCLFKTQGRPTMRQHANQVHGKKRVADEEIS
jgi:hypothetical protein